MDNFFEILIYLILIISFLSSIFKKKTKELPKPEQQSPEEKQRGFDYQVDTQTKPEQPGTYSSKENQYDILRELENLFKTDAERGQESSARIPIPGTTSEEKVRQESFESSGWHEPTMSEHKPTYTEHAATDWRKVEREKMKRKVQKIDSKVTERAEQFEKLLKKKPVKEDRFVKIIKERLNNPKSLKEYIIISEIIGKPKSLL
jgi:hypothetical protein